MKTYESDRHYVPEEIALRIDDADDKTYLPDSIMESLFDGKSLANKREGYFYGKYVGFHIGLNAFKPHRVMRDLENSCKSDTDHKFFKLLDIFFNRFGIGITFHPNDGMIFTRFKAPEPDESALFHRFSGGRSITMRKDDVLQELHLDVEEMSNEDLSTLLIYIDTIKNGKKDIVQEV